MGLAGDNTQHYTMKRRLLILMGAIIATTTLSAIENENEQLKRHEPGSLMKNSGKPYGNPYYPQMLDSIKHFFDDEMYAEEYIDYNEKNEIAKEEWSYLIKIGNYNPGDRYKNEYEYDSDGKLIFKVKYGWDAVNDVWRKANDYAYDSKGNLTMEATYTWSSSQNTWNGLEKLEYTYDSNDKVILKIEYKWNKDIDDWIYYRKDEFTFDNNGNQTYLITHLWNSNTNNWGDRYESKGEYIYDNNGNVLQVILSKLENDEWKAFQKAEYEYDDNNNRVLCLEYNTHFGSDVLELDYKYEWAYDNRGNMIKENRYNGGADDWVWRYKYEYAYDNNGNQIFIMGHQYFSNNWVGIAKYERAFDEKNNLIYHVYYTWNYTTNEWKISTDYEGEYNYNAYGNTDSEYDIYYDENKDILYTYSTIYYYSDELVSIDTPAIAQFQVYPNPSPDGLFHLSRNNTAPTSWVVYNINGSQLLQGQTNQVDLRSQPAGIYLIRINTDKGVVNNKLTKR